jgi:ParB-like chromosome segregation protein Spo0J
MSVNTVPFNALALRAEYPQAKPLHDLCLAFPWIAVAELTRLGEDIKSNGQHQPILVKDGAIIDGKNRELACLMAGIEPMYQEWQGTGSLVATIMSLNWQRRHLSESQRADIAAKLIPALSEELQNEKAESSRKFANVKTEAKERAAELMNVSPRTTDSAMVVQQKGSPEIKAAVSAGELTVSAAVKEIKKNTEETKRKDEEPTEYLITREMLGDLNNFIATLLVKIEERAAKLKEPLRERMHLLITGPEWTQETVEATLLVYDQWIAIVRTEKERLYHKERKLFDNLKWLEKEKQYIRETQRPLLQEFDRPPEKDLKELDWKPKVVRSVSMGTKLPRPKPVKATKASPQSDKPKIS